MAVARAKYIPASDLQAPARIEQEIPCPPMSGVFNFTFVPWFRSVAPYIHMHRGKTIVIGVPGEAIAAGKLGNIAQ